MSLDSRFDGWRVPIRVVFYREDDAWIAHCLEFDLVGDGETREQAMDMLARAISLQAAFSLEHDNIENLLVSADPKFHRMYFAGRDALDFHFGIERISEMVPIVTHIEARESDGCEIGLAPAEST